MPQPKQHASHADRQTAYRKRCEQTRQAERSQKGLPPSPKIPTIPGHQRWKAALQNAHCLIEIVRSEMEDYYNDRSETWQESELGEHFQERLDAIAETQEQIAELMS